MDTSHHPRPLPGKTIPCAGLPPMRIGDTSDLSYRFQRRFADHWAEIPKYEGCYYLFDSDDKVVFLLQGGRIAVFPDVTAKAFMKAWESGGGDLLNQCVEFLVSDYGANTVIRLMGECGIDL